MSQTSQSTSHVEELQQTHRPQNRLPALLSTLFLHLLPSIFFGIIALFFDEAARLLNRAAIIFHPPSATTTTPPESPNKSASTLPNGALSDSFSHNGLKVQDESLFSEQLPPRPPHHQILHHQQVQQLKTYSPPPEPKSMSEVKPMNELLPSQDMQQQQQQDQSHHSFDTHDLSSSQFQKHHLAEQNQYFGKSMSTPASNWPLDESHESEQFTKQEHQDQPHSFGAFVNNSSTFVSSITPNSSFSSSIPSKNTSLLDINNSSFISRPSIPKINNQQQFQFNPTNPSFYSNSNRNSAYGRPQKRQAITAVATQRRNSGNMFSNGLRKISLLSEDNNNNNNNNVSNNHDSNSQELFSPFGNHFEGRDTQIVLTEGEQVEKVEEVRADEIEQRQIESSEINKYEKTEQTGNPIPIEINDSNRSGITSSNNSSFNSIVTSNQNIELQSTSTKEVNVLPKRRNSGSTGSSAPDVDIVKTIQEDEDAVRQAVTIVDTSESPSSSSEVGDNEGEREFIEETLERNQNEDDIDEIISSKESIQNNSETVKSSTLTSSSNKSPKTKEYPPGEYVKRRVNNLENFISNDQKCSDGTVTVPVPEPDTVPLRLPVPGPLNKNVPSKKHSDLIPSLQIPPTLLLRSIYAEDLTFITNDQRTKDTNCNMNDNVTAYSSIEQESSHISSPTVMRSSTALFSEHAGDSSENESNSSIDLLDTNIAIGATEEGIQVNKNTSNTTTKAPTSAEVDDLFGASDDFDVNLEDTAPTGVDSLRELIISSELLRSKQLSNERQAQRQRKEKEDLKKEKVQQPELEPELEQRLILSGCSSKSKPLPQYLPQPPSSQSSTATNIRSTNDIPSTSIILSHDTSSSPYPSLKRELEGIYDASNKSHADWKNGKQSNLSTRTESYSSPESASTSEGGSSRAILSVWKKDQAFFEEEPSMSDLGNHDLVDNEKEGDGKDTETPTKPRRSRHLKNSVDDLNPIVDSIHQRDITHRNKAGSSEKSKRIGVIDLSASEFEDDRHAPNMEQQRLEEQQQLQQLLETQSEKEQQATVWSSASILAAATASEGTLPFPSKAADRPIEPGYHQDNEGDLDDPLSEAMSRARWSAPVKARPIRPSTPDAQARTHSRSTRLKKTNSNYVSEDDLFRQSSYDVTMLSSSRVHMHDRPRQNSASGAPTEGLSTRGFKNNRYIRNNGRVASSSTPTSPSALSGRSRFNAFGNRKRTASVGADGRTESANQGIVHSKSGMGGIGATNGMGERVRSSRNDINSNNKKFTSNNRSVHMNYSVGAGANNHSRFEDWPEYSPSSDRADENSRIGRRHVSDMSFGIGINARKVDMLPPELLGRPEDEDDEFWDLPERFRGRNRRRRRFGRIHTQRDSLEAKGVMKHLLLLGRKKKSTGGWGKVEESRGSSNDNNTTRESDKRSDKNKSSHASTSNPNSIDSLSNGRDVKFESELNQETVFSLLNRICPECGFNITVRRKNQKIKMEVPCGGDLEPILVSVILTKSTHGNGSIVSLTRSKDDVSGGPIKDIQAAGTLLKRSLESHVEFIEDSFASLYVDGSNTTTDMESYL